LLRKFLRHLFHHFTHEGGHFVRSDARRQNQAKFTLLGQKRAFDGRVERIALANPIEIRQLLSGRFGSSRLTFGA